MTSIDARAGTAALDHLTRAVGRAWAIVRRVLIGALILAGALVLLELVHLHGLLASVHPWLAHGVIGALVLVSLAVVARFAWRWWTLPGVLTPPELPAETAAWSRGDRAAYLKFARRYLERQSRNPAFENDGREAVREALASVGTLSAESDAGELVRDVEALIDRVMEPIDRRARREVWRSATEIAVLTAVNPSAMLDVLITLLRNLELSARIATLYFGRPGLVGTAKLARDVLAVAATAGVLDRVVESAGTVAADMAGSWSARVAGPVGQGLVNGLLTVRLGDAAVERCRSLRSRRVAIKPWDIAMWREMARRLASAAATRVGPSLSRAFSAAAGGSGVTRAMRAVRGLVRGEAGGAAGELRFSSVTTVSTESDD